MQSLTKATRKATVDPWPVHSGLDDDRFEPWRSLLEERTGIRITPSLRALMEHRLRQRMLDAGYEDLDEFFSQVTARGLAGEAEWQTLVDCLTVQETRFFRDPHSMELVADHMKAQWRRDDKPLQLWSVGCSTGEEAYSLAMIMAELARNEPDSRRFAVTGSDISAPAIHKARLGRYSQRALSQVPATLKARYFDTVDQEFVARQGLTQALCFTRLNILALADAPISSMDLIYCQNVLIYFRRWRRRQIAQQLVEKLRPGGLLVLGSGELPGYSHPSLVTIPSRHCLAFLRKHTTDQTP